MGKTARNSSAVFRREVETLLATIVRKYCGTIQRNIKLYFCSLMHTSPITSYAFTPRISKQVGRSCRKTPGACHSALRTVAVTSTSTVQFSELNSEPDDSDVILPLANPLERFNRLGTSWFGVVCELEGVLISDSSSEQRSAWYALAREEGLEFPPEYDMDHYSSLKAEQLVSQVFNWSHNSQEIHRLVSRKHELFIEQLTSTSNCIQPGTVEFLDMIIALDIPCVLLSQQSLLHVESIVKDSPVQTLLLSRTSNGLAASKTNPNIISLVTSEDVRYGLPDTEGICFASSLLQRPLDRMIIIGSSLQTLEAALELDVRCVMLSGRFKSWELAKANLVVGSLNDLCFQNLKNLFQDI